jgi:hypothetical protein
MNNLKFRAWDKANKEMLKIDVIDFFLKGIRVLEHKDNSFFMKFSDVEIMQSTGLFDKNGVEIFEGDIVRNTHTGSVGRVHWCVHNTGFFYYVEKDKKNYTVFRAKYNLEVIGNTYENKELIQNEI